VKSGQEESRSRKRGLEGPSTPLTEPNGDDASKCLTVGQCWNAFLVRLEFELGKETVDRWARTLVVKTGIGPKLVLEAKDSFQALWFEEHLRPRLSSLVDPIGNAIQVTLQVAGRSPFRSAKPRPQKFDPGHFSLTFPEVDPVCIFDHFLPIADNEIVLKLLDEVCAQLAGARLRSLSPIVATSPDGNRLPPPNPIFLSGPSGCGKTHLLMATAQRLRQAGLSVIVAKSDLFTEHVVRSIRAGEMSAFRKLWRNVDALLVDDIHCLARKSATQEEFFHTFNSLHVAGKQIILTANCLPQQLQFIEPRLVSRFEWGVVLPMQAIPRKQFPLLLERRAQQLDFSLSPKMAHFLAETFSSTPKACINALQTLIVRLSLAKHRPLATPAAMTLSQIADLVADLIEDEKNLALTPEKIINVTAETYGITREDLLGRSQSREFVLPRQIAMFLIRKHLKAPFMRIGELFSKNHSTVMSAIRQVEKGIPDTSSDIGSALASIEIRLSELGK
jgi:chromosomal replication initiator protein